MTRSADPYKYFRIEAQELVEQMGQGALDLEKGVPSTDAIARMLRWAHTLKGAARVVKQPEIAEHAHALEDVFAALRESAAPPDRSQIDAVLQRLDQIGIRVAALGPEPEGQAAAPIAPDSQAPVHAFRPDAADMEAVIDGVSVAQTHLATLRPMLDQADRIRHLIELVGEQLGRSRVREGPVTADSSGLQRALSMVDELRGRFDTLERSVLSGIDRVDRQLRELGEAAARLRLVPASAAFHFLERATRDASLALGKRVVFQGRGNIRIDSTVLTIVQGALLQLVRNAVAHGIEASGDERRAAGKPLEGRVSIEVSRRGATVAFVCSDDGRGVDFDEVRRLLQRKGLADVERRTLDTDALLRALLEGGISTCGTVTDVAGRGIGLDVVREAAKRLGGDVRMRSERGQGTSVELIVPAAVSSFQALLVEAAGVAAAVPLDAVRRTMHLAPGHVFEGPQGSSILLDGASIPLWPLGRILRSTDRAAGRSSQASAFIVDVGGQPAAFAVDRVLGTATVVMRPLPNLVPPVPPVVGASLDAGGDPRLVLDPASLVLAAGRLGASVPDDVTRRPPILVIDDSLTTRMLEQSILESAGYEVTLASSGEEGLEKARAQAYALFLVDVEMPGIDGFTFIEQIRSEPVLRTIPSILVTSRASAADRRRGHDVGAQGYIVKSEFDQEALLDQIRTLVQ